MKFEWRKEEKNLYLPKQKPEIINVPRQKFFMVSGKGNPNDNKEFSEKIGALYSLSYAIRMMPKNGFTPEGYFEYTVYPLEGVWDLTEEGRKIDTLHKNELVYTIMIRQPNFVNEYIVKRAFEVAKKKNTNQYLDDVVFDSMEDGLCVQMMHVGSYDDEKQSFDLMKDFIAEKNIERESLIHREIYISDFRKVEKEKLKTVLRFKIKQSNS